jgi:predicted permease
MMNTFWQDLRYGARRLLKQPGFALIAVLTLALGIGANTAIFSLVSTALLRPLPVERAEQLVAFNSVSVTGEEHFPMFSIPNYRDLRDRNNVLAGLLAYRIVPVSLSKSGVNERLWGYLATGNYFDVLGVKPALGRFFTPADDQAPGAHPVAVITYDCWQKRFAADPQTVGKTVLINGRSFTVIGVAPPRFYGTEISFRAEVWFPLMMLAQIEPGSDYLNNRDASNFFVQGRLKPGVTLAQAESALRNIAAQLAREFPKENEDKTLTLSPPGLLGTFLRGPVMGFAGVLMAVVGLVLLLACTNLANLSLARATERRKEIAVRLALGASRRALVRQLLTESLLLAALGGALGLGLAYWLVNALLAFKPPLDVPLSTELHIDGRVLLFTLVISLLTGVVFGLLPALQATKLELVAALKDEPWLSRYRRSWLRNGLVVLQVSLSFILLICAGLVLRGLQRAQELDPGFVPQQALELSFDLSLQAYNGPRSREFNRQLLQRVRALPGVQYAGITDFMPLGLLRSSAPIYVEGQPAEHGAHEPAVLNAAVSPDLIPALGTRLLEGRDFTEQDAEQRVAIVNETFARRHWPGQSALGKRIGYSATGPWREIVGVVQDGKYYSLSEEATPFVYTYLSWESNQFLTLIVRTTVEPPGLLPGVRREFQQLDAALPVYDVKTLVEHMALPLFPARVAATLLGSFGLLALLLATIGVYGVMSYVVAQRTHELGVRMVLGAQPRDVLKLVLKQGLALTLIGVALGLSASFAVTGLMEALLFGVSATDPLTFAVIVLLLTAVALVACWLPARRATRVDPLVALRCE